MNLPFFFKFDVRRSTKLVFVKVVVEFNDNPVFDEDKRVGRFQFRFNKIRMRNYRCNV